MYDSEDIMETLEELFGDEAESIFEELGYVH